jgi:hypothetical protein
VANTGDVQAATASLTPGATVELVVERRGAGRVTAAWTVKERDRSNLRFWVDPAATDEQRAILEGILTGTPRGV